MAREELIARIGDINDFSRSRPLVTIDEFFVGNTDRGSIGYNLPSPPAPSDFYTLFGTLLKRADVSDIRVEVMDMEDPNGWPAADTVWFVTSASVAEVRSWFPDHLAPDEVFMGFESHSREVEPYEVPEGMKAVAVWYD